jgi:flagellar operon protein
MSGVPNPALIPPSPTGPLAPVQSPARGQRPADAPTGPSFSEVLAKQTSALEPPRFSRHALDRLSRRGIDLNDQTMGRLAGGVARAAAKGSRDSVVFVDGTAFVVSVKNNTVITAVGSEHMKDQVFTNIDSAVIA